MLEFNHEATTVLKSNARLLHSANCDVGRGRLVSCCDNWVHLSVSSCGNALNKAVGSRILKLCRLDFENLSKGKCSHYNFVLSIVEITQITFEIQGTCNQCWQVTLNSNKCQTVTVFGVSSCPSLE